MSVPLRTFMDLIFSIQSFNGNQNFSGIKYWWTIWKCPHFTHIIKQYEKITDILTLYDYFLWLISSRSLVVVVWFVCFKNFVEQWHLQEFNSNTWYLTVILVSVVEVQTVVKEVTVVTIVTVLSCLQNSPGQAPL